MEERAKNVILYILKAIKYKADLSPNKTISRDELNKKVLERILNDKKGLVESTKRQRNLNFDLLPGRHILLFREDLPQCNLRFDEDGIGQVLERIKEESYLLKDLLFTRKRFEEDIYAIYKECFDIILIENFDTEYEKYIASLTEGSQKKELEQKIKNSEGDRKKELTKISIITPQYGKFDYLWIVFNDEHKNKIRMSTMNKQGSNDYSYGKKLFELAKSPTKDLENDKSFRDNMNSSIWNTRLKKFKKINIIKQENNRMKIAEGVELETMPVQSLSESIKNHYPKNL